MIRNNPVEQLDRISFVNTSEPGTPFSFFRWLFWNRKIELNSEKGKQVFRHEMFHIEQKHSLDIMYLEMLSVFCWINPFFHLAKKEVKAIHEFLADEYAISENNKWEYAELLLMQALNTPLSLVNPFFHNQIKRRIAMITTSKKSGYQYLRKLMVFPVAIIVLALFAFNYKEKNKANEDHPLSTSNDISFVDTTKKRVPGKIVWIEEFIPAKKTPTAEQLKLWTNPKIYGVWLDDKRVDNSQLTKYQAADFVYYFVSKLEKNAVNYGKHYYQVGLLTNQYYNKVYLNPESIQKYMILRDTTKPLFKNYSNQKTLIVIDGVTKDDLTVDNIDENINVTTIESVTILKGTSAHSKYGDKGNEGVIEIITKKPGKSIAPHLYDTLPKPHTKQSVLYFQKEKVVLESATVIYKPNPEKNKLDLGNVLVIINGEKKNNAILKNKTIIAERIIVYSKGDAEAVKLYGKEAENGVMVFEDASIHDIPSMEFYKDDFIKTKPSDLNNIIFDKVEVEPSFPGGEAKWKEYLERNLDVSIPGKRKARDGAYSVVIQFIVDREGNISDLKPLTKHGYGMEEEVVRVVKGGPKWEPALQNGLKVKAYRKQVVTFIVGKGEKNFRPTTKNDKDVMNEVTVVDLSPPVKETADDNIIFEKVEIAPSFPGGDGKWKDYLIKNINATVPVDSGAPAGKYTVIVQFIVRKDGFISNLKALTKHGFGMEEEALRVIKNGPRWVPALQNGKQVTAYKQQPITFQISEDPDPVITKNKVNDEPKVPEISLAQLRKADVYKLLQLDEGTEIISFRFTSDFENGDIKETYNSGNEFSESTKKLITDAKQGQTIIVDQIRIKKDGIEKKMPGKAYEVIN